MLSPKKTNDEINVYLNDLKSRVVAESGIKSDEYHIGKLILRSMKDSPELLLQIDAGTDESENFASALRRSIQFAIALKKMGLQVGDVIDVMSTNHLDLTIPVYAALYLGIIVTQTYWNYPENEMQHSFRTCKPKVIFCHPTKRHIIRTALDGVGLRDSKIITIGDESDSDDIRKLLKEHADDVAVDKFKATDFDPAETVSFLVPTSGTTGLSKAAMLTHKNLLIGGTSFWTWQDVFPGPTALLVIWSPFQWISAICSFTMSAILKFSRVQTSKPDTFDHFAETIKQYKPTGAIMNPATLVKFIKFIEGRQDVDLSSFDFFLIGGSAVTNDMIAKIKSKAPNATTIVAYGMTEMAGLCFYACDHASNVVGKPMKHFQYKLVDTETNEEIKEPNVPGELWVKGESVFKGYYNNPEGTASTFFKDGWLKTGDVLCRDDDGYYSYVDRCRLFFKHQGIPISPLALEEALRQHPAVAEVAVGALTDPAVGSLPVACVTKKVGSTVTANEMKEQIRKSLPKIMKLRSGVIFTEKLPLTVTGKIDRTKLKELIATSNLE